MTISSKPFVRLAALLIVPIVASSGATIRGDASSEESRSIQTVAWMSGHWIGVNTEDLSEELWLPPAAGRMVGVWRWATNDQLRLYELLAVAEEGGQLVLRLRHFRPDLHGLEEKDAPFVLTAVSTREREVTFEGKGRDGLLRIGYKAPSADTLEAFVERGGKRDTFSYRRKGKS